MGFVARASRPCFFHDAAAAPSPPTGETPSPLDSVMIYAIARHCEELNRCNQRGGRMLSIFDLLAAETLHLDLATYLMARISRGASFMVGAVPGGAGTTTVMCALLNFVPSETSLIAATPGWSRIYEISQIGKDRNAGLRCGCRDVAVRWRMG